ncbi:hypothetical protein [Streptomyces sp. A1547]|uniref:hypothetical protein n=1 Tax=Streptomyces sp. A1547 TaxID=2563105 RepID=UPI00109EAE41|nr:hypothetical protein [Streptomyces sp. A1547]THA33738.1 hypothetical protein E6W17_31095 [Streptomyces sp. A1547]
MEAETGEGVKKGVHKDILKLIKELKRQGFEVNTTSENHPRVSLNGKFVTTLASTPSDRRGWKNAIAVLRRHGFAWPH